MRVCQSASSPVVDSGEQTKGEADTEGHGHSVLGVCGHALEDLPGTNDGFHNSRQTRLGQHNVSSTTGSISGTCTNAKQRNENKTDCAMQAYTM